MFAYTYCAQSLYCLLAELIHEPEETQQPDDAQSGELGHWHHRDGACILAHTLGPSILLHSDDDRQVRHRKDGRGGCGEELTKDRANALAGGAAELHLSHLASDNDDQGAVKGHMGLSADPRIDKLHPMMGRLDQRTLKGSRCMA